MLPNHSLPTQRTMQNEDLEKTVKVTSPGSVWLAFSAIAWNAAGSWIARSDSTLRSTTTPDLARPSINRL